MTVSRLLSVFLVFSLSVAVAAAQEGSSAPPAKADPQQGTAPPDLSGTWVCKMVPPLAEIPPTEMLVTHKGSSLTTTNTQVRSGFNITSTCTGKLEGWDGQVTCEVLLTSDRTAPQTSRSTSRVRVSDEGRLITLRAEASESPHRSECRRK